MTGPAIVLEGDAQSVPKTRMSKSARKDRVRRTRKSRQGLNPVSGSGGTTTRVLGAQFQADAERVTLRFVDVVTVTPGAAGGFYAQAYGLNTPRVPERTFFSGVAQGWSQYAARFKKYVCMGSSIRWAITHAGDAGSNGVPVIRAVMAPITAGGGSISGYSDAAVQKYSKKWAFPTQAGSASATLTSSADPRNVWRGRHSMTVSKLEGEPVLRTAAFEALTTADPSVIDQWLFNWVDIYPTTAAASKPVMIFEVEIFYDCLFFERIEYGNTFLVRAVTTEPAEEKKAPPPDASPCALDGDLVLVKRSDLPRSVPVARPAIMRPASLLKGD